MAEATVRGFSIATRCETVEEFIETYRDRSDAQSILVNVVEPRVIGTECAFAILLANKKPVLAGTCVVLEVFKDTNNVFKRPGMRLGINRLGPDSELVFARLQAERAGQRRAVAPRKRSGRAAATPSMLPIVTGEIAVDIVMPRRAPPVPPREPPRRQEPLARAPRATPGIDGPDQQQAGSSPVHVAAEGSSETQTRVPGSRFVLPANPLMNLTDASLEGFVDCQMTDPHASTLEKPTVMATGTLDEQVAMPADDAPDIEVTVISAPPIFDAPRPEAAPEPPEPVVATRPAPFEPLDLPYPATRLPDLPVGKANDHLRAPLVTRRLRKQLLLAVLLVPALGAALAMLYMWLAAGAR